MRWDVVLWASAALLLMAAETFAPGAFLLWLGFAAAGVFLVVLLIKDLSVLWQVVLFAVLSFVSIGVYVKWFRGRGRASEAPLLNRRGEQLVGQVHVLETAIVDGRGRLKIGDAFWSVHGPDLPVGHKVRVIGVDSMVLRVLPAE
jgi:hypothetical protein